MFVFLPSRFLTLSLYGHGRRELRRSTRFHQELRRAPATESSCLSSLSVSILGSVAAGLYPTLLPARSGSPHPGLDIYNAAAPEGSLRIALAIYMFGMMLVGVYLANIYRLWRGKYRGWRGKVKGMYH